MEHKYIEQMEEIKRRIEAIEKIVEVSIGRLYLPVVTESVYLQFRKILELIAMASLVVNKEAMEEFGTSMQKLRGEWNGYRILKQVEAINPNYYPVPIVEKPSDDPCIKVKLESKTNDYLTKDMFSELYNIKCGRILHADNPLKEHTNYSELWDEGPLWKMRIMGLLNTHQISLVGHEGFHLVHMQEENDKLVHMYQFENVETVGS